MAELSCGHCELMVGRREVDEEQEGWALRSWENWIKNRVPLGEASRA